MWSLKDTSRGTRPMTDRDRAFHGLLGRRFPRVGQRGLFTKHFSGGINLYGEVEVLRVSKNGEVIWTRFVTRVARLHFAGCRDEQRWWRVPDDCPSRQSAADILYRAGSAAVLAPHGEISFPDTFPTGTL